LVLGVVDRGEVLDHRVAVVVGGPVGDDDLQRPEHRHAPQGVGVVVAAHVGLEQFDLDRRDRLRHADLVDEGPHRLGRVAALAQP
ncbi:hypothetical protein DF186_20005, partial [Enterococcus hirae]